MSQVTASLVKELREKTGVGMMDCKTALKENNGDIEASIDWLRTKGIAKAAKKEGRIASEGLIAVEKIDNVASIIEVNSETDFVARNEDFQNIVKKLSILSTKSNNLEELLEKDQIKMLIEENTQLLIKVARMEEKLIQNAKRRVQTRRKKDEKKD